MHDSDHDLDGWSPQGPVTELGVASSWELLNASSFGRLGVSVNDQPKIFPVNYYADGSSILFRTAGGTKLHHLLMNRSVVFEVDDRTDTGAWSVIVEGTAQIVSDEDELNAAERAPLPDWVPVQTYVFVRITPTRLHGRRFQRHLSVSHHTDDQHTAGRHESGGPQ
ncbi:MAG TPA: pyridoxamine 5'-phosphate oxidase family protein [Glaciihabitans sp.]|nr:pyridoxamine 5'-phosphate oxidase family protein [Glaciihabitans sp.]